MFLLFYELAVYQSFQKRGKKAYLRKIGIKSYIKFILVYMNRGLRENTSKLFKGQREK